MESRRLYIEPILGSIGFEPVLGSKFISKYNEIESYVIQFKIEIAFLGEFTMKKSILITVALLSLSSTSWAVRCADFSSQQEAQNYMEQHGARKLDRDKDGEACECLPGGSKYGSSICRR